MGAPCVLASRRPAAGSRRVITVERAPGLVRLGEISVDGVSRRFRVHARETRTLKDLFVQRGHSGGEDIWALRDVSLSAARGEAVGLIGRNGSGKTTLLRLIAGIIRPTTGRVSADGRIGS